MSDDPEQFPPCATIVAPATAYLSLSAQILTVMGEEGDFTGNMAIDLRVRC